jgi:hypothetical protein
MAEYTSEEWRELLRKGESQSLEFKDPPPDDGSIARNLTAFANTDGGTLCIGVDPKGRVVGLTGEQLQLARDSVTKIARSLFSFPVDIGVADIDGRKFVYARVPRAPDQYRPVANAHGHIYVRNGAQNVQQDRKDAKMPLRQSYRIMRKTQEMIEAADAIIADLTLSSNNVYFELGLALGMGKPCLQTARKDTVLDFDVHGNGTVFYKNASELEQRLVDGELEGLLSRVRR